MRSNKLCILIPSDSTIRLLSLAAISLQNSAQSMFLILFPLLRPDSGVGLEV